MKIPRHPHNQKEWLAKRGFKDLESYLKSRPGAGDLVERLAALEARVSALEATRAAQDETPGEGRGRAPGAPARGAGRPHGDPRPGGSTGPRATRRSPSTPD